MPRAAASKVDYTKIDEFNMEQCHEGLTNLRSLNRQITNLENSLKSIRETSKKAGEYERDIMKRYLVLTDK